MKRRQPQGQVDILVYVHNLSSGGPQGQRGSESTSLVSPMVKDSVFVNTSSCSAQDRVKAPWIAAINYND